jgi:hypothetical protein
VNAYYVSAGDSDILANWLIMVNQLRADHAEQEYELDGRDLYIAAFRLLAATEVLGGKGGNVT